jgi:hypothetical protein
MIGGSCCLPRTCASMWSWVRDDGASRPWRTVDTAHAFVSVTTQREVLYVAATRGREGNRLYVDTMYDPDADTQHGLPAERDAGDVLRAIGGPPPRFADISSTY